MARFVLRRLAQAVPLVLLISLISFFIIQLTGTHSMTGSDFLLS